MLYVRVLALLICLALEAPVLACPAMVFTGTRSSGQKTRHEDKKIKKETSDSQSKPLNADKVREVHA